MAIYHLDVSIIKRSKGESSVEVAALLSGEILRDERLGKTHNPPNKIEIIHSEIMLPVNAPTKYKDRATLWNSVEKSEIRYDAQVARKIGIAIPVEFDRQEQIEIMREYIRETFVDAGMCADFGIHLNAEGTNPFAHILLTMRPSNQDGTWGNKAAKEYMLDENGERIRLESGEYKSRHVKLVDWYELATLLKWRKNWADICNKKFKEKGLDVRIDHRTLEEQGIDREPTIHIGKVATSMERRGIETRRGKLNREIIERNKAKKT